MYTSEKNTKQLTVRGGVNPYGQPDRKISGFFFDDFPKYLTPNFTLLCQMKHGTSEAPHFQILTQLCFQWPPVTDNLSFSEGGPEHGPPMDSKSPGI